MTHDKGMNLDQVSDGQAVAGVFAVQSKEPPKPYKNKPGRYFSLVVSDRTGSMRVKVWGGPDPEATLGLYTRIRPGQLVHVEGDAAFDPYDDAMTIAVNEGVHLIEPLELSESGLDPAHFLPESPRDRAAMAEELRRAADGVKEPHLRALLDSFLNDEGFAKRMSEAPSSVLYHHATVGGNLEHTLGVVRLCKAMADAHPELDRDLLVTGAILHDIGKVQAYTLGAAFDQSDEGQLLGHVTLGDQMVRERIAAIPGFPRELELKLRHMILAHHAKAEWGALHGIHTAEAAALHFADLADSQVALVLQAASSQETEDDWLYASSVRTRLYLG